MMLLQLTQHINDYNQVIEENNAKADQIEVRQQRPAAELFRVLFREHHPHGPDMAHGAQPLPFPVASRKTRQHQRCLLRYAPRHAVATAT